MIKDLRITVKFFCEDCKKETMVIISNPEIKSSSIVKGEWLEIDSSDLICENCGKNVEELGW